MSVVAVRAEEATQAVRDAFAEYRAKGVLRDEHLAAMFKVNVRTIGEWARRGLLPTPLIGGVQGCSRQWSAKAFFVWLDSGGAKRR